MTALTAFQDLLRHPIKKLLRRWNWKSAICSSLLRAGIFFVVNLTAGWRAATGAMLTEFLFRALTAGFYGALTQAFCQVEPPWQSTLIAMLFIPLLSHALEAAVHMVRGTPNLAASVAVSLLFTAISTQFNLFAMRNGALVVEPGAPSLTNDLQKMPRLILEFLSIRPQRSH